MLGVEVHRVLVALTPQPVAVVEPEAPLSDALKLLAEGYIRLPVVGPDRKLVGSLSSLTILRRFRF